MLNFEPGTQWSYSNTATTSAAMYSVRRVSRMSFADFTRTRIFEPLGMRNTSSARRSHAHREGAGSRYIGRPGRFSSTLMPFGDNYGNGGLLTTVRDLAEWKTTAPEARWWAVRRSSLRWNGAGG